MVKNFIADLPGGPRSFYDWFLICVGMSAFVLFWMIILSPLIISVAQWLGDLD